MSILVKIDKRNRSSEEPIERPILQADEILGHIAV